MISTKEFLAILLYYKKYFFISLAAIFLMVMLQQIRFFVPQSLVSPQIIRDPLDIVRPSLEVGNWNFNLKEDLKIVKEVSAASDFDQASSYLVLDFDSGEVLKEKNMSKKLPIASLTKVMTAVVALDLADPGGIFTISKTAADQIPTKLGMVVGQKMTLEELLNGLLLVSANDGAEVIKEGIDQKYGAKVFVEAMNEKAKILGLKNSHFQNPQGFDHPRHYSSSEDLAKLIKYALVNYPLIAEIVKKDYQFYPGGQNHKQIDMYNWNGLLNVYPNVLGVKIGNTDSAAYTTAVISEREGKKVLVILLGAPGVLERDMWAGQLLDSGFEKLGLEAVNVTEEQLKNKYASWKYWR